MIVSPHKDTYRALCEPDGLLRAVERAVAGKRLGGATLGVTAVEVFPPPRDEVETRGRGATWSGTARVVLALSRGTATGRGQQHRQYTFYLSLPWMTEPRGTFVVRGLDYVPLVQLLPRPGLWVRSALSESGLLRVARADLVPEKGCWIRFVASGEPANPPAAAELQVRLIYPRLGAGADTKLPRSLNRVLRLPPSKRPEVFRALSLGPEGRARFTATVTQLRGGRCAQAGNQLEDADLEAIRDCLAAALSEPDPNNINPEPAPASPDNLRALTMADQVVLALEQAADIGIAHLERRFAEKAVEFPDLLPGLGVFLQRALALHAEGTGVARVHGTGISVFAPFGDRRVVQPLDETNPLAELAHARKLSRRGQAGVNAPYGAPECRDLHESQRGRLCPFETPESEHIGLNLHLARSGKVEEQSLGVAHSSEPDAWLGACVSLIPFLPHNDAARALMGAKNMKQAVPLVAPEKPLVSTGREEEVAGLFAVVRAAGGGNVKAVVDNRAAGVLEMKLDLRDAAGIESYQEMRLPARRPSIAGVPAGLEPRVKEDEQVRAGQVIAAHPAVSADGALALGANACVAYMPFRGLNFEDGIVVSQSLATRLTSQHLIRVRIPLPRGHVVGHTHEGPARKKGADVERCGQAEDHVPDSLDDRCVIRLGTEVRLGDELARTYAVSAVKKVSRTVAVPEYDARPRRARRGETGKVVLVRLQGDIVRNQDVEVEIWLESVRRLQVGDKLMGRHGNKGVVTAILPDAEMPHVDLGEGRLQPVEAVLNPVGMVNRMNLGQLAETHIGWLLVHGPRDAGGPAVPSTWMSTQRLDADQLERWFKQCPSVDAEGKARVLLGKDGSATSGRVVVGYQYLMKLNHLARDKVIFRTVGADARGGGYGLLASQPLKGRRFGGGQRVGEMEMWALQAWNAPQLLREFAGLKSDDVTRRSLLTQALEATLPSTGDDSAWKAQTPESCRSLALYLAALGFRLDVNGKEIGVSMLDDQGIVRAVAESTEGLGHSDERRQAALLQAGARPNRITESGLGSAHVDWVKLACGCEGREDLVAERGRAGKKSARWRCRKHPKAKYKALWRATRYEGRTGSLNDPQIWASPESKALGLIEFPESAAITHPITEKTVRYLVVPPPRLRTRALDRCYAAIIGLVSEQRWNQLDEKTRVERLDKAVTNLFEQLLETVGTKSGFVRQRMLGKRVDLSGRAVIVGDPTLKLDQCGIPLEVAVALAGPAVRKRHFAWRIAGADALVRGLLDAAEGEQADAPLSEWLTARGCDAKAFRAAAGTEDAETVGGFVARLCQEEIDKTGIKVVLNRAPSLHRYSVQAFEPRARGDGVIGLNPLVCGGLGADFDGDTMAVHVPVRRSAMDEAWRLLKPSVNLRSVAAGQPLVHIAHEMLAGLAWMAVHEPAAFSETFGFTVDKLDQIAGRIRGFAAESGNNAETAMRKGFEAATAAGLSVGWLDISRLAAHLSATPTREAAEREVQTWLARNRSPLAVLAASGAMRSPVQTLLQLAWRRGSFETLTGVPTAEVNESLVAGLDADGLFHSAFGARKTLAEKKLLTPKAGDLTRFLVWACQGWRILAEDCGTTNGIRAVTLRRGSEEVLSLARWAKGRFTPGEREPIGVVGGTETEASIRSPLTCRLRIEGKGLCARCCGLDLSTGELPEKGWPVGAIAATSIGERGTQLAMKTFQSGGVSGLNVMTGFPRVRAILQGFRVPVPGDGQRTDWDRVAADGVTATATTTVPGMFCGTDGAPDWLARVLLFEMYSSYKPSDVDPRHFEVLLAVMVDDHGKVRSLRAVTDELPPLDRIGFRNVRSVLVKLAENRGGVRMDATKVREPTLARMLGGVR